LEGPERGSQIQSPVSLLVLAIPPPCAHCSITTCSGDLLSAAFLPFPPPPPPPPPYPTPPPHPPHPSLPPWLPPSPPPHPPPLNHLHHRRRRRRHIHQFFLTHHHPFRLTQSQVPQQTLIHRTLKVRRLGRVCKQRKIWTLDLWEVSICHICGREVLRRGAERFRFLLLFLRPIHLGSLLPSVERDTCGLLWEVTLDPSHKCRGAHHRGIAKWKEDLVREQNAPRRGEEDL
jgi:hypothetical protein